MEIYRHIVSEWMDMEIPEPVRRDAEIDYALMDSFILAVIGPRRSGKTYFMYQMMRDLMESGVSRESIFYINLEDDRLAPLNGEVMDGLLDAFHELYGPHDEYYLFLDEIQNLMDWQGWVKRVKSLESGVKIVISGSSARLLSKEISTGLRGRVYSVEILPVSFREYVRFRGYDPDELLKRPYGENETAGRKLFREYTEKSTYPALSFGDFDKRTEREVLQSYYEAMIMRDVVERYSVRDVSMLRGISRLLLNSVASEFTYTKLRNSLKSMGFSPSKSTVIDYVSHLEDAYLFFTVNRFRTSEKKRQTSPKKLYIVDAGMLDALTFTGSEERGKKMENLVFLELLRRKKDVFYYRDGRECDFIVTERGRVTEAIQVTENLKDSHAREFEGLKKAIESTGAYKGTIITETERDNDGDRNVIPIWEWMLRK